LEMRLLLLVLLLCCSRLASSYLLASSSSTSRMNQKYTTTTRLHAQVDVAKEKARLQNTEMLFVLPLAVMNLPDITSLNKALVAEPFKTVMTKPNLLALVDRTPFCQIADYLSDSSVVFFVDKRNAGDNYTAFMKWVRTNIKRADKPFDVLVCRKEHCVRIPISQETVQIFLS
jgi:hypothetical protein